MRSSRDAAPILLLAVAGVLGACGQGGASTLPDASPGGSVSPAASVDASPSAAPSVPAAVVPQLPAQSCCSEVALDAGRYALPGWLGPLVTVQVEAGLGVINDAAARYLVFGTGDNSVGTMANLVALLGTPGDTDVTAVVSTLTSITSLEFEGEPRSSTMAGFEATVLDATARPNPERTDDPSAEIAAGTVDLDPLEAYVEPGFALTTSTPEARLRFIVIDIESRVVVAWLEAPPAEADAFFADAETLLGSLQPQAGAPS